MQVCELDEKTIEVLKVATKLGKAKFYSIYKESSLPLATAWRRMKKALEMGLIEQREDYLQVTERGLVLLAFLGDPLALARLAKLYDVSTAGVEYYMGQLRRFDVPICLSKTLVDTLRYLNIAELHTFKGTAAEPLVAKLFLQFCRPCGIEVNGNRYIMGTGYIVATYCRLCNEQGRYELFATCPLLGKIFSSMKKLFINAEKRNNRETQ